MANLFFLTDFFLFFSILFLLYFSYFILWHTRQFDVALDACQSPRDVAEKRNNFFSFLVFFFFFPLL